MLPLQHIYKQFETEAVFYAWFISMHTRVDIVLNGKDEEQLMQITENIYRKLYALEKTGDFYNPSSELSAVNNTEKGIPRVVSNDLFTMIEMCISHNKGTDGYFDISIDSDDYTADTIKHLSISKKDQAVTLNQKGMKLNLSGFVKGYALDQIKEILAEKNINNALINIGNSSVLAIGNHPFGNGWKIGVTFPTATGNKEIVLIDKCLTTSGNHTACRKHIKSPYTGKYIEGINGISVITNSAADGEALSTALFAAEPEKRAGILRQFEATVYSL